ncbi:unnamed protein product [Microthlaspi erraticum]|uniref:Jacalin-type lectin domain-containing protein n=1 Tax=Microthlaspi erraticum TaxID=1685480 RepID=A0A6D2IMS4_9BRAS|nr:unnamed protein product [Microthlaspi erraticum]
MTKTLEAVGGKGGTKWDHGSDHDGVAKVYVRGGPHGILNIQLEYVKNGQLKGGDLYNEWERGFTQTFEINYLSNEHLESVEVYYDAKSTFIQGLQFKTSFRVSELIGYDNGTKFSLELKGNKIVGFYGSSTGSGCVSLGAYVTWIQPTRLEAKGSNAGKQWDDGADHDGVTKIHVRGDREGIQSIKVGYLKSGQQKDGSLHGLPGGGFTQPFEINRLVNEHLISVEGYYDATSGVIQALQFKTNMKNSKLIGYEMGKKFSLAANGREIIGFHGCADKSLNSLGAYFTTVSVTKSEIYGGIGSTSWDDGVFDSIRKVSVSFDNIYVTSIRFVYNNRNTVVTRMHGVVSRQEEEFELDYPNELITSVEGTLRNFNETSTRVTSLTFKTSKGRTSPTIGHVSDSNLAKFTLERKGCALVGFHGRQAGVRNMIAIGAYYYPLPPPNSAENLKGQGGNGGASWEDGVYDGVRKVYVGIIDNYVAYLKFVYEKNTHLVIGDDHGNKTLSEVEEFGLEHPREYITAVEGYYDKVAGSEVEVITMLRFKTNIRAAISFGCESTYSFVLQKEGYKIVGFHGKASNMIHQLGVHVIPISH